MVWRLHRSLTECLAADLEVADCLPVLMAVVVMLAVWKHQRQYCEAVVLNFVGRLSSRALAVSFSSNLSNSVDSRKILV